MAKFLTLNVFFIMASISMVVYRVHSWYIWTLFILIWCVVDAIFAKDVHLKWWHWALVIIFLTMIDLMVFYFF